MKPLVYLAGPISGLSYGGATDWREYAAKMLEPEVKGLSPMRNKQFLSHLSNISGTGEDYKHISPLATARGVMTRDRFDCTRCDVLLVNFLGAKEASIGTCMEIAWADLSRIPIVCAIENGSPAISGADRAWLAALVDGEGSVHLTKRPGKTGPHYGAHLSVTQANLELLEEAKRRSGGRGSIGKSALTSTGKQYWRWHVMAQQAAQLLRDVYPWLVVKRQQAALAVELMALQTNGGPKQLDSDLCSRRADIYARWRKAQDRRVVEFTSPAMFSSPLKHMMVDEAIGYSVDSLDDGLAIVKAVLGV